MGPKRYTHHLIRKESKTVMKKTHRPYHITNIRYKQDISPTATNQPFFPSTFIFSFPNFTSFSAAPALSSNSLLKSSTLFFLRSNFRGLSFGIGGGSKLGMRLSKPDDMARGFAGGSLAMVAARCKLAELVVEGELAAG